MITSERLNLGRSNLAVRYIVQKSRRSSKVKIKGQGHQGQKIEKLLSHPHWQCIVGRVPWLGRTQQAATHDTIAWPPRGDGLRRWENQRMLSSVNNVNKITRWLYCVECRTAHNTVFGLKRPAICTLAVYFLHSTRLVSRDSIVDRHWLPATDCCHRYLPCCQPSFDVAENLGRFLVRSVQTRGMTLNWFQW